MRLCNGVKICVCVCLIVSTYSIYKPLLFQKEEFILFDTH